MITLTNAHVLTTLSSDLISIAQLRKHCVAFDGAEGVFVEGRAANERCVIQLLLLQCSCYDFSLSGSVSNFLAILQEYVLLKKSPLCLARVSSVSRLLYETITFPL